GPPGVRLFRLCGFFRGSRILQQQRKRPPILPVPVHPATPVEPRGPEATMVRHGGRSLTWRWRRIAPEVPRQTVVPNLLERAMATMNLFRRKRRLTYLLCLTLAGQTTFSGCFPKERKLTYFGDAHLQ